jgi:DNA-binding transcriptional LysR family regulator
MAITPWFIRARLRTRHLMLLTAIGENGNIHKAAQMLNMSQPAASRLLRDLEDIVGAELFDRLPRGVRANWYGEAMIRHARMALASLSDAASEIDLLKAGQTGQVNVGAIAGPAIGFVPRAIAQIVRRKPMIRVQLQVQTSDHLLDALQDGKLDMMVGRLLDRHDKSSYEYARLAEEPVCAAVRLDHPLLQRHDLDLRELADLPWIVPPVGSDLRNRFDLMFREAGLACPGQIIEAVSTMVIARLVEETDHLAVLPRDVAEYCAARKLISIAPVQLACHMDSYGIVTRKGRLLSPSASMVYEAFASAAKEPKPNHAVDDRKLRARDRVRLLPAFPPRSWQDRQGSEPVG